MYALASKLINLPVLSLQNADTLTRVTSIVLNPDTLKIVAFGCEPMSRNQKRPIIVPRDVRQIALDCLLVDTEEVIGEASEVVRLATLLERPFELVGKRTVTEMKRVLGKVDDYVINLDSFEVQKFEVRPSLMHSWLGGSLMIDRRQIVEVTPNEIIVREATNGKFVSGGWLAREATPKP